MTSTTPTATATPTPTRSPLRLLLLFAVSASSLVAATAVIGILPQPLGGDLLAQKLAQFRDLDAVDTVLVGSSRIHRQIDPRILDEEARRRGSPMRSFNLGVPGTRMLELSSVVRRVLRERPQGLRLLVVDSMDEPLNEESLLHSRAIRWHDRGNLVPVTHGIVSAFETRSRKISALARHGQAFLYHFGRLGTGLSWLAGSQYDDPIVPAANRGFLSLDEEMRGGRTDSQRQALQQRFDRLHKRPGDYQRRLRRLRRSSAEGRLVDPFELGLFESLQTLADRHDVRIVFLIDARIRRQPNLVYAYEIGAIDHLLRFDDLDRYPQLYDPQNRYDIHHLNEATAARFTRLVAAALIDLEHSQ